ncbi:acyloxyacyl hydrolase [Gayadomonas joobiniege]|uniref:acyloxyacyl hydrolase n=1 Tax=Gayadomonas joobiniege TaxID=1234606 RepID=UPI0003601F25|nr:acyloxyacyl hydrolase [Gayadomonas joobiniege]
MKKLLAIFFIFVLVPNLVKAGDHAASAAYIQGEGDVQGIKLAYQYYPDYQIEALPLLELYFETSINFWRYNDPVETDGNAVIAFSPAILYPLGTVFNHNVELEFGIGLSLLDDTKFAGKDVSTHYQFEDRIGFVTKFGKDNKQSVSLRYLHYSNGGFKSPNPGLDFISLTYAERF